MRHLTLSAFASALAAATALAPAASSQAAGAQIAGVLTPPRVRRARAAAADTTLADSASRAARTSAQTPEAARTRLDIQAWVDSAAGALARSRPAPIPAPGSGGRPSIFSTPAVPDSLRPPPVESSGAAASARAARPRRTRSAPSPATPPRP